MTNDLSEFLNFAILDSPAFIGLDCSCKTPCAKTKGMVLENCAIQLTLIGINVAQKPSSSKSFQDKPSLRPVNSCWKTLLFKYNPRDFQH